jgi:hypothetical protein
MKKEQSMARLLLSSAALAATLLVSAPLQARSADSLSDLVGARASGGESDLEARGWRSTESRKASGASFVYWWHPGRGDCVVVTTRDGRFSSILDARPSDCGQSESHHAGPYQGGGYENGGYQGGGSYGGRAPTVAMLSNGNLQVSVDSKCRAYYDRSGRRTMATSGCDEEKLRVSADAADRYRREQGMGDGGYGNGSHGGHSGGHGYNDGYVTGPGEGGGGGGAVAFGDLVGARAAGAESDLEARGFRAVDNFTSGNDRISIWWNGRTRQCLQMITVDGRANSVTDIHTHPRCR